MANRKLQLAIEAPVDAFKTVLGSRTMKHVSQGHPATDGNGKDAGIFGSLKCRYLESHKLKSLIVREYICRVRKKAPQVQRQLQFETTLLERNQSLRPAYQIPHQTADSLTNRHY